MIYNQRAKPKDKSKTGMQERLHNHKIKVYFNNIQLSFETSYDISTVNVLKMTIFNRLITNSYSNAQCRVITNVSDKTTNFGIW